MHLVTCKAQACCPLSIIGYWEAAATPSAPATPGDAMLSSVPLAAWTPLALTRASPLREFFHAPYVVSLTDETQLITTSLMS